MGTVAAAAAQAPLVHQALIASAIIAWSGLSVHGQVASVLTGTDIRMVSYMIARFLHAIAAAIFTVWLMGGSSAMGTALPVFGHKALAPGFLTSLTQSVTWAVTVPAALLAIGGVAALCVSGLRWTVLHHRRA